MERSDEAATLLVYGSLLDARRREEVIGHPVEVAAAELPDYETGRVCYFYLRPRRGVSTRGLLLLNLTNQDFEQLDRYEELPRLYTREHIEVLDQRGNRLRCWVYLPTRLVFDGIE